MGDRTDLSSAESDCTIGASGIRTLDQGMMSPFPNMPDVLEIIQKMPVTESSCTTSCTQRNAEVSIVDPELVSLVIAWPTIPMHIKAAIQALLGVTG